MSSQVFTQSAEALGTTVVLQLVTDTQTVADNLFKELWRSVEQFEQRFSRFLSTSELTEVNQSAGERVIISDEFCALAARARELGIETDGIYNPFILPAVQKAGYVRSIHSRTANQPTLDYRTRKVVQVTELEVGSGWVRIPADTALDFGGIGKGYLADLLAKQCHELSGYCLSISGDMAVSGKPPGQKSWGVQIEDADDRSQNRAQVVSLRQSYGVATSGQKRIRDGQTVQHSIDATTKKSLSSNVVSATVVTADTTTADVYAGVVLQAEQARLKQLCKNATLYAVMRQLSDGSLQVYGNEIVAHEGRHDS